MKITRKGLELHPTAQGLKKNGPLYYLSPANYNLPLRDQAVAIMIKAYIQEQSAAPLERIVSKYISVMPAPGIPFPTVRNLHLEKSVWVEINGDALAELIDAAIPFAREEVERWSVAPDEVKYSVGRDILAAKEFLQTGVLEGLDGKRYTVSMPEGIAEFVTDCWLIVHFCQYR